jgi:hypothetical protein
LALLLPLLPPQVWAGNADVKLRLAQLTREGVLLPADVGPMHLARLGQLPREDALELVLDKVRGRGGRGGKGLLPVSAALVLPQSVCTTRRVR